MGGAYELKAVIGRLQEARLTVNPSKCQFAKTGTEYVCYIIRNRVIKDSDSQTPSHSVLCQPQTNTQLKSFLRMSGWYRRFVPNYSSQAAGVKDITRRMSPSQLQGSEKAECDFMDLKDGLSKNPYSLFHCRE